LERPKHRPPERPPNLRIIRRRRRRKIIIRRRRRSRRIRIRRSTLPPASGICGSYVPHFPPAGTFFEKA
jgi:hypothetical protein